MPEYDVLIIGAGAAGMMAGRELSKAGKKVLILEARDRLGGRIHTVQDEVFPQAVEMGAEFIHGQLPQTLNLLKEGKISFHTIEGRIWNNRNGRVLEAEEFIEGWEEVMEQLHALKEDVTIARFIELHLQEEKYAATRKELIRFTEGYDAADIHKVSAFALREEWQNEDDEHQYRIEGGYGALIQFLEASIIRQGGTIQTSSVVKEIHWNKQPVEVVTEQQLYSASKVLITVPVGVLQAPETAKAAIKFVPHLPQVQSAVNHMGFGSVLKVQLLFQCKIWELEQFAQPMQEACFIFSDALIPTWWTQFPNPAPMLTGWLAGPKSLLLKEADEPTIINTAIESIAKTLNTTEAFIRSQLIACKYANWAADPYALGAYSYPTLHSGEAIAALSNPVNGTIYFAGEAFYKGSQAGTVEGALSSGKEVSRQILSDLK